MYGPRMRRSSWPWLGGERESRRWRELVERYHIGAEEHNEEAEVEGESGAGEGSVSVKPGFAPQRQTLFYHHVPFFFESLMFLILGSRGNLPTLIPPKPFKRTR